MTLTQSDRLAAGVGRNGPFSRCRNVIYGANPAYPPTWVNGLTYHGTVIRTAG